MLANGITLSCKRSTDQEFAVLAGLKEVPELGNEPEKVENTGLSDTVKQYEFGIGDPGDLEYKFKFNNAADSAYRKMKAAEASKTGMNTMPYSPPGSILSPYPSKRAKGGVMQHPPSTNMRKAATIVGTL